MGTGKQYCRYSPQKNKENEPHQITWDEVSEQENLWYTQNRIARIFNVITQYGEENFYLSYSGGMDSTVLSELVDMALPKNKIPRVYADTGIELNMVRAFVKRKKEMDDRIEIIKPSVPIKKMLEEKGYPFKSKNHSRMVNNYKNSANHKGAEKYLRGEYNNSFNQCPKCLKYQFEDDFKLKISDKCCSELKEKPLKKWEKENKKPIKILGIMKSEGGRRQSAICTVFRNDKLKAFQPLFEATKEWELWFIDKYNIDICDIYKPPYNFERTGCKGCPFTIVLQKQLDILEKYCPAERKQCEAIWKPVYDEYRRIGYRLKKEQKENE